jgi:predicted pyridoxine 5'-phosphate oxidase superfamily flavin-nucleotide-binding protein
MPSLSTACRIETTARLRQLIAEPPALMKKRLQTQIDAHCKTIIEHASVCAVGFAEASIGIHYLNVRHYPVVNAQGTDIVLTWPAGKARPSALSTGEAHACSLFFIMPGIGFALRANGRCVIELTPHGIQLQFTAQTLFLHCSRAKVRAQFWAPRPDPVAAPGASGQAELSDPALDFVRRASYLLMLTRNPDGSTELSPRGDPDGFVLAADRRTLLIPERPGNKVACSLLNILAVSEVSLSLLIPGASTALTISGQAWLTADPDHLHPLAINGKVPALAIVLEVAQWQLQHCPELVEAGLWQAQTHLEDGAIASFPKMLAEHMNGTGLLGKATTLVVDAVVKHDLKHLY